MTAVAEPIPGWDDYWRGLAEGEAGPAVDVALALHDRGMSLVNVVDRLVAPAQVEVGRLWADNEWNVAGTPVMVGGRGFGPDGRWGRWLGANAAAATAGQALELLSSPTWPRFTDPAPPLPVQDGSVAALGRHHSRIVAAAYRNLEGRWPSMQDYNAYQLARTEEDLGYLVDFLSAALYVDDPDLYRDFIGWMVKILSSRGVPPQALRAGLVGVAEALQQLVEDAERPQRLLAAAVDVVNRSTSAS